MKAFFLHRCIACAFAFLLLFSTACAEEVASAAKAYMELSTEYPAMTVKAGDSLTFDLILENQSGVSQEITLRTASILEGWSGSFSASSKEISIVHIKNEATNKAIDYALGIHTPCILKRQVSFMTATSAASCLPCVLLSC